MYLPMGTVNIALSNEMQNWVNKEKDMFGVTQARVIWTNILTKGKVLQLILYPKFFQFAGNFVDLPYTLMIRVL